MRVCLLTPGHLSTNPRLVKEADALAAAGYDVEVIASDFVPWGREADRCFSERPWRVIRTLCFGPHAPPLSRTRQLVRRGLARALLTAGAWQTDIIQAAWHPLVPDLVRAACEVRADLYIAHYPAALPAAAIAAKRHQTQFAFDAEDFHLGDVTNGPENKTQAQMVHAIESAYLPHCTYVTAASPGIADALVGAYGIARPTVVLNVFPRIDAPESYTPQGTASPSPSVYWFSQTIGPDRGLECAVRAIGRAQSRPHLYLRGMPAKAFLARLQKIATDNAVADRLHVLPPALPSEMTRLSASYDVGFVGETGHTPNRDIALTNKQFTYLLAGIPAVMSDIPAHRDFASREVDGAIRLYPADDFASLASVLEDLFTDSAGLQEARAAAWRLGQERFNWDIEQRKFLGCVEAALGSENCSKAMMHAESTSQLGES